MTIPITTPMAAGIAPRYKTGPRLDMYSRYTGDGCGHTTCSYTGVHGHERSEPVPLTSNVTLTGNKRLSEDFSPTPALWRPFAAVSASASVPGA